MSNRPFAGCVIRNPSETEPDDGRTSAAGTLASFYNPDAETPYFAIIGLVSIGVAALLIVFRRRIGALMSGVR